MAAGGRPPSRGGARTEATRGKLATMHYEGIEYAVRASPGLDQWTLLIYFTQKGHDETATVIKFNGSREAAAGAARRRIDNWLKRQRRKSPP
jgi:hypothetical protein